MAPEKRVYMDCSEVKGSGCTLRISGKENEVMKAAMDHGISTHGFTDTPENRAMLQSSLKEEYATAAR